MDWWLVLRPLTLMCLTKISLKLDKHFQKQKKNFFFFFFKREEWFISFFKYKRNFLFLFKIILVHGTFIESYPLLLFSFSKSLLHSSLYYIPYSLLFLKKIIPLLVFEFIVLSIYPLRVFFNIICSKLIHSSFLSTILS